MTPHKMNTGPPGTKKTTEPIAGLGGIISNAQQVSHSTDAGARPDPETTFPEADLQAKLAAARQNLARRTEVNSTMAAWRDSLQRRIDIEQLRAEACGCDDGRQEALTREAADFSRTCRYFGWRGKP